MTAIQEEKLVQILRCEKVVRDDGSVRYMLRGYAGSKIDMTIRIKMAAATLSQQHERDKKEVFKLAQEAYQRSLAKMKEHYEREIVEAKYKALIHYALHPLTDLEILNIKTELQHQSNPIEFDTFGEHHE